MANLRISIFLALVTFSLTSWTKYLSKWGFENVAIDCPNDDSCTYKFRITRDIESPDPVHRRTDCNFTVNRLPDNPAEQVNMTNQLCKGTFDEFWVSGQWYYRGFLTFCVVHEASDSWAFFGYQAQLILNSIVPRMYVSDSFRIGTYNGTDLPPGDLGGSRAELWPDTQGWSEAAEPVM